MAIGPQDTSRHAGQVVRRVLLRRNIAIDAETAQLVAAAQAALQTGAPSRPPRRVPACSRRRLRLRCSDIAPAIRSRACSCLITGNRTARCGGVRAGGIPPWRAMLADNADHFRLGRRRLPA